MTETGKESKGRIKLPAKNSMTRRDAVKAIGVMSAGMPFIKSHAGEINQSNPERMIIPDLPQEDPILAEAIKDLEYLTPADRFIVQRRGNPVLTELPQEKLPSIGLTQKTWKLEIIPDPQSDPEVGNPLTIEKGNALLWADLMKLAEDHSVRYLHVLSCTNAQKPYGMGLWEGIPLRRILWTAAPGKNIRRVCFSGYHNDDPGQIFRSSLPVSRVLEEAPGELPVILCYKLNGRFLSHANGGPVRLFVPGLYGNRSIKWLQKIILTNSHQANDTYAEWNNDVESPIKTYARFIKTPEKVMASQKFAFTGMAQVGMSGLKKVQYWIHPSDRQIPDDDLFMTMGRWEDAIILPPPRNWGSDLPDGRLHDVIQIDATTGQPVSWPLTNTIVHWAAVAKIDHTGKYDLRCRTIDANEIAQPMPRPFGRSGINTIESASVTVEI
jgi:DMSO/TMAO reductase YedYZ molybdopterin-dependent catalytic subunit